MESARDIVVIVFSATGTVTSVVLLIMCFRLYGRTSQALERVGRASDDLHAAAEGARSGMRLAKCALEIVGPALPGPSWLRMTYRAAAAIPSAVRFLSRFKRSSANTLVELGEQRAFRGPTNIDR